MFQVFDSGKPADTTGFPRLKYNCWKNSKFSTLEEAQEYAKDWLGELAPKKPLELNKEYTYGYAEEVVVIKEV